LLSFSTVKAGAGHTTRHSFIGKTRYRDAFTYTEMMMALAILALVAASTFAAMTQANRFAVTTRVYTCAQTLVQTQIDTFLSVGPFYPQLSPPLVPAELAAGTTTTNNVPIYADTASGSTLVSGTMTRTVVDLGLTQTTNSVTDNLNTRRLTVTLAYTFLGKNYSIVMNTLRASDS
jgi:prepilin-type N-terminal cleavage/methylation domain-containing protein